MCNYSARPGIVPSTPLSILRTCVLYILALCLSCLIEHVCNLTRTGCRACALLLKRICTQHHEIHNVGKKLGAYFIMCLQAQAGASNKENADSCAFGCIVVLTAERFLKPCKAWCISCNVHVQL